MNKNIILKICAIFIIGLAIFSIISGIAISNREVRLRNLANAKLQDNQSELDNLQKKIYQTAQVTREQMNSLKEIITSYTEMRGKNGGTLMSMVHEVVPNIDTSTFKQLMNIIVSSRDAWTMRQKELLSIKNEHDNLLDTFPSSLIVGSRPRLKIIIVTSDKAEEAFRTGKDNDIDVFNQLKPQRSLER